MIKKKAGAEPTLALPLFDNRSRMERLQGPGG